MTQSKSAVYESLNRKFSVGTTSDGYVNTTVFAKNGETVTKSLTKDEARELAIQLLKASQ